MTASDKKKVGLLVVLVALMGVSWYYVFRPIMMTGSPANSVAKQDPKKVKPIKAAQTEGRINLEGLKPAVGDIGRRNLFQFPPKAPPKPLASAAPPPVFQTQVPPPTMIINTPPAPTFNKTFKYEGVSVMRGSGRILGAVSEGGNTYQVKEGDCLMGQYCVTRLTESLIEFEDVQLKQRRQFNRLATP